MRLAALELWLPPADGPLLARVQQALRQAAGPEGEALRWAITAVDPQRGLRLEAVLLHAAAAGA